MLVLHRRASESVRIGKDIKVTVLRVSQGVVQLGIEAPREVVILRTELEGRPKKEPTNA